jgi:hypothetical protein
MSWIAVGSAAVGVVGNYMSSKNAKKENGGAGTTTVDKSPWAAAAPWLEQNLSYGQALQNQYQAQPFSQAQTAAYGNSAAQSDYMRSLVPSLLDQMQGQQLGYDVNNPTGKPSAFQWDAIASLAPGASMAGAVAAQPTSIDQAKATTDANAYTAARAAANNQGTGMTPDGKLYSLQKKLDPIGAKITKGLGLSKLF